MNHQRITTLAAHKGGRANFGLVLAASLAAVMLSGCANEDYPTYPRNDEPAPTAATLSLRVGAVGMSRSGERLALQRTERL